MNVAFYVNGYFLMALRVLFSDHRAEEHENISNSTLMDNSDLEKTIELRAGHSKALSTQTFRRRKALCLNYVLCTELAQKVCPTGCLTVSDTTLIAYILCIC